MNGNSLWAYLLTPANKFVYRDGLVKTEKKSSVCSAAHLACLLNKCNLITKDCGNSLLQQKIQSKCSHNNFLNAFQDSSDAF